MKPAYRLAAAVIAAFAPAALCAQDYGFRPAVQWEARADAFFVPGASGQIAAGLNIPAGLYLRSGLTVGAGPHWYGSQTGADWRLDLTTRYLMDPLGQLRWGLYGGAGLSARCDAGARCAGFLLLLAGIEGPAGGTWRTAFEAGLGGGARVGIVLRRTRTNGR